jgi:hypothetical protein
MLLTVIQAKAVVKKVEDEVAAIEKKVYFSTFSCYDTLNATPCKTLKEQTNSTL